ncbi:MAG TPA: tetratricopeptide repeat protein [Vicinamibacterales bacterium]|nr:tetratricopeptide repeat protein [Vicinamibacterales bacterium]
MLLLVVLAAYQPAWQGGLLWDDDRHVTASELRSAEGLVRIWTELGATQQYYPVVHSVFWLEHRLWGDATLGYHLVNIGLHALSAFLIAVLLTRLAVPGAWLAALIFALHPVHAESVAWISELKNTLSTAFYLLAALAYLTFDRTRGRRAYAAAALLFLLALGSKTVTATLPAALLVVFWWERGRLDRRRDVAPLLPFLAAGVAAGLFTAWVERAYIGAAGMAFDLTFVERTLVAGRAIWFYLGTLLWPFTLAFTYPRWEVDETVWWQYLYPAAALVALGIFWRLRRRTRGPLAVALLFTGTLLPALGFVDVYPFRFSYVADHFQYLASMSVITGLSVVLFTMFEGLPSAWRRLPVHAVLTIAVAASLGALTAREAGSYVNAETLYRETIRRNPDAWIAHSNLGGLLLDDRPAEARGHVEEALRLNPDLAEAHNNLGILLHREGRIVDALAEYERAALVEPGLARAHNNRCLALTQLGRPIDALAACELALAASPTYPEALYHSGIALQILGRTDEATSRFERAVAADPSYAEVHYQLGLARQRAGRPTEAMAHLRTAAALRPRFAEAHNDLGLLLVQAGRADEAVAAFRSALEARPGFTDGSFNLGSTLLSLGRSDEAVPVFEALLEADADDAAAHNNLGVALLGLGRAREAVPHFREALRLDPDLPEARENLQRALAGGRHPTP